MKMSIEYINRRINESPRDFVTDADADYNARITAVAEDIRRRASDCPLILLSGPSGSGKTTTALMIESLLDSWGCETHTLSMDDYFIPLTAEEQRLAAEDKFDLESPTRVDCDFLNTQLEMISRGQPVELPKFNFKENKRRKSGCVLTRKMGEPVILEGIHALNPSVVTLPDDSTTRIYVSVRTRIETTDGEFLHPSKIRLMRRMLRDNTYRNRHAEDTLLMYDGVERGENKYIMPFKHRATHDIDTFIPYEVSVYRTMLEQALERIDDRRVDDIKKVLAEIEPLDRRIVPEDSLIREFIGNGKFNY